jgi:UDP-sulfoquinovose synthase
MTGVDVNFIPNPRQEAAENELDVSNSKFCNLGLDPITLDTGLFDEVTEVVKKYKSRCNPQKILPASFWNKKRAEECASIDPTSIKIKEEAATATPTTAAAAAAASS